MSLTLNQNGVNIEQALGEMLSDKYIDGRMVLREIELQHGIFIERQEDTYSFSHLTFQEYLTALHIIENEINLKDLVSKYLCDRRWREVFLILAGLRRADDLLLTMEEAIYSLLNTPKLQNLLTWVERVTDDFQPVGKRVMALANANANANANAFAYANANAYANAYGNAYGNAFAIKEFIKYTRWSEKCQIYQDVNYSQLIHNLKTLKQQIPDKEESKQVHQAFGQQIIQTWLEAFHLTPEMVDLSESEIKALDNYLYTNLLMVECEKAAVRRSPETWSGIESRMLLPVRNNQ